MNLEQSINETINDYEAIPNKLKGAKTMQYKGLVNKQRSLNMQKYHATQKYEKSTGIDKERIQSKIVKLSQELGEVNENREGLKRRLNNQIGFDFNNRTVTVKKSYLERLKEPDKYVKRIYAQSTQSQIIDLLNQNKPKQAAGLYQLILSASPDSIDQNYIETYLKDKGIKEADIQDIKKNVKAYDTIVQSRVSQGVNVIDIIMQSPEKQGSRSQRQSYKPPQNMNDFFNL